SRANLERDVRGAGWKYNQPTRCIYGYDNQDCVDDYIRYRVIHAAGRHSVVALISHDGGYRPALKTYLQAGGSALILGFVERMSHKLFNLSYDWQAAGSGTAKILDLQFDAQA